MATGSLQFQEPTTPPQARCAYCLQPVDDRTRTACPLCRALYHAECWKANDSHCAVYGCGALRRPPDADPPAAPRRRRSGPIVLGSIVAGLVLFLTAFIAADHAGRTPGSRNNASSRAARLQAVVNLCAQGRLLQDRGDLEGAERHYTNAVDLGIPSAVPFHNRAVVRALQGNLQGALSDYSRAVELDPQYATAWRGRGFVRHRLGQDGAMSDLTRAIELDPGDARAYAYRGELKKARKDPAGALSDFARAVELEPGVGARYHDRGHARADQGDLRGAVVDFTRAFELDPANVEPLYDRACRRDELRDWPHCIEDYERAAQLAPELRDRARLRIFLVRVRMGHRDSAAKELAAYLEQRDPGRDDAWSIDLLRFACGRLTEAALLQAAAPQATAADRGRRCEAYYYAGMLRLAAGDRAAAAAYFRTSVDSGATTKAEHSAAAAELRVLK